MGETYGVKKFAHAVVEIWSKRTGLEQILLLVSAFLLGSIVVLVVMLSRDSAPLATEWGPVASWAGVVVTFLGFVGAIAALKVQRTAVDVTVEQHKTAKAAKERTEYLEVEKAARKEQAIKEQEVSAVRLVVFASRPWNPMNATFLTPVEFSVGCRLDIPPGRLIKHLKLTLPEVPEGFSVVENTTAKLSSIATRGADARWLLRGKVWPHGAEAEAKDWLAERIFVTFTDSSGIKWKIDGHGVFTEISENVGAGSPS